MLPESKGYSWWRKHRHVFDHLQTLYSLYCWDRVACPADPRPYDPYVRLRLSLQVSPPLSHPCRIMAGSKYRGCGAHIFSPADAVLSWAVKTTVLPSLNAQGPEDNIGRLKHLLSPGAYFHIPIWKLADVERCGVKVQMLRWNFLPRPKMTKIWNCRISPRTQLTILKHLLPTVILTKMLLLPGVPNLPSQSNLIFWNSLKFFVRKTIFLWCNKLMV